MLLKMKICAINSESFLGFDLKVMAIHTVNMCDSREKYMRFTKEILPIHRRNICESRTRNVRFTSDKMAIRTEDMRDSFGKISAI